ncbi:MAG: response regulator [Candidatus Acidiferrales bacterium]
MSDAQNFPSLAGDAGESRNAAPSGNGEKPQERRRRRRALISAPIRVRGAYAQSNGPDEISTTVDVSRNGFLFLSARADFSQGMTVAVTFPYSKSSVAIQVEQPGRVVRVSRLADGRFAIAIALPSVNRNERGDAAGSGAANPASDSGSSSQTPGEPPLVIVVDADPSVRKALRSFLTTQGYEVMALPGARQAHALLNQMLPALLIAEIEGDDLPGYDLCARIKSTPRLAQVPVVLTTRSAYPSDYSNAHSLGAVVCLAKPFRIERIGHVVRLLVPIGGTRKLAAAAASADGPSWNERNGSGDPSFRLS